MIEIQPQFTYSPEGVLSVRTDPRIEIDHNNIRSLTLEDFSEAPGVEVSEAGDTYRVDIEVQRHLGRRFNRSGELAVGDFLQNIGILMPSLPSRTTDRVIAPSYLSAYGFSTNVYEQFQRMLNAQEVLDEEVAKCTLRAMTVPYGGEEQRLVDRDFRIERNGRAKTRIASITLRQYPVHIHRYQETEAGRIRTAGDYKWNEVDLSTWGIDARMGAPADELDNIVANGSPKLYEMTSNNIDLPQQYLSVLLGFGALAYKAATYEGHEDIYAGVKWGESRVLSRDEL